MFLIPLILLIYFLGFKKYYICIKDVSAANKEELTKVLKYELSLSLTNVKDILRNAPYDICIGTFLESFTVKRKISKTGAEVSIYTRFFWQKKVEEGPRNPAEPVPVNDAEGCNEQAWQYLNEITEMSYVVDDELVLNLTSVEDATKVDELLDKAEECAGNPLEERFFEQVVILRNRVSWALKRHWTHSWLLIGGVILSIVFYMNNDVRCLEIYSKAKSNIEIVENWQEVDITLPTPPETKAGYIQWYDDVSNPIITKAGSLCEAYGRYLSNLESIEMLKEGLAVAKTDEDREEYQNLIDAEENEIEENLEKYEEIRDMNFDDFQEYVLDDLKSIRNSSGVNVFFLWAGLAIMVLMIPLYIMASYQYGYIINKYQKEAGIVEKIKAAGFALAAGVFGMGIAMKFFPDIIVKTTYSNGSTSTHTEADPVNFMVFGLKIILFVIAALILCVVSTALVAYLTVTGLYRNYKWKDYFNKIKAMKK